VKVVHTRIIFAPITQILTMQGVQARDPPKMTVTVNLPIRAPFFRRVITLTPSM